MKNNSAINIMIDTKTKEEATIILKDLGLSMSTAITLFLKQVIKNDGLPFELKNKKTTDDPVEAIKNVLESIKK